jgi:hypothetical protein
LRYVADRYCSRTTVEICTAIIAACIPCLKPLFKTLFDGTSAAQHYGSRYKGYIRNTDTNKTPNSGTGGAQFEMFDRSTNFTSDVKGGISTTGSEESILPQNPSRSDGITKTTAVFVSRDQDPRGLV